MDCRMSCSVKKKVEFHVMKEQSTKRVHEMLGATQMESEFYENMSSRL